MERNKKIKVFIFFETLLLPFRVFIGLVIAKILEKYDRPDGYYD